MTHQRKCWWKRSADFICVAIRQLMSVMMQYAGIPNADKMTDRMNIHSVSPPRVVGVKSNSNSRYTLNSVINNVPLLNMCV